MFKINSTLRKLSVACVDWTEPRIGQLFDETLVGRFLLWNGNLFSDFWSWLFWNRLLFIFLGSKLFRISYIFSYNNGLVWLLKYFHFFHGWRACFLILIYFFILLFYFFKWHPLHWRFLLRTLIGLKVIQICFLMTFIFVRWILLWFLLMETLWILRIVAWQITETYLLSVIRVGL